MATTNSVILAITERIAQRSKTTRANYLERMRRALDDNPPRKRMSCGNVAHAVAACSPDDKEKMISETAPNLGIVTAYNDMLSAHQPYKDYPDHIKEVALAQGATAQIAGGVPAMCDGVTQGQPGMELSLFSRDVIAMATAVSLSHNMFDGNLFLGICDKIVPGMMIGALEFGHLPACFIPAGPMPTGLPNKEKGRARQQFASGEIDRTQMLAAADGHKRPLAEVGSTNHTMHLVAMARAAGLHLTWDDIDELSAAVPLLARIYPNGQADVNDFHEAGGMSFLFYELRRAGLLNEDVVNIMGDGLEAYEMLPELNGSGSVEWNKPADTSGDYTILTTAAKPFAADGGLKLLKGNLGKAIMKVSAVKDEHRLIKAPCKVYESQQALEQAFHDGELFQDMIAVVRFQGPSVNGMPELHKMTPLLGTALDKGYKVALVTDGRMSGASGKVPAAIHVSPEANLGGLIGKVQDGDMMIVDANHGTLELVEITAGCGHDI